MNPVPEWADQFGQQVSHGITNSVDIPSHHPFSPERLRYVKNGSRVRDAPSDSTFTDREQDWLLEPAAGDTVTLYSAERPRYIVGVDASASLAGQVESSLGDGDTIRFGLSDRQTPENAAFFEVNGNAENRIVTVKGGSESNSQTWTYPNGVDETTIVRYEIRFNWYGVGTYQFLLTYTKDGQVTGEKTVNKQVGELSLKDEKPTNDANQHIFHEVDASNSGVQYGAGSMGFLTYGSVSPTDRTKKARIIGTTDNYSGTGDYEPLAAIRVDPEEGGIFTQFSQFEVVPDGGDGEALIIVVPETETDATGFSTPPQHSPTNSVIKQTTSVTEFPDQSGTIVTSASDPNGYQVGFYATDTTGTGATQTREVSQGREVRPLYEDDVAIVLYKADTATARTVNIVYGTKQLW